MRSSGIFDRRNDTAQDASAAFEMVLGDFYVRRGQTGSICDTITERTGDFVPTAWLMLQKIRKAMEDRDEKYQLAGIVELDESYFGAPKEGGKRGRGTEKAKVLVGVSLDKQGRPLHERC
ncbi:hypothetical protein FACS1894161_4040 [Spirochaetia bacterium]|nr:hypothetical protein FACS1894161_4040 [Spirochaetia bacterium]